MILFLLRYKLSFALIIAVIISGIALIVIGEKVHKTQHGIRRLEQAISTHKAEIKSYHADSLILY